MATLDKFRVWDRLQMRYVMHAGTRTHVLHECPETAERAAEELNRECPGRYEARNERV